MRIDEDAVKEQGKYKQVKIMPTDIK